MSRSQGHALYVWLAVVLASPAAIAGFAVGRATTPYPTPRVVSCLVAPVIGRVPMGPSYAPTPGVLHDGFPHCRLEALGR